MPDPMREAPTFLRPNEALVHCPYCHHLMRLGCWWDIRVLGIFEKRCTACSTWFQLLHKAKPNDKKENKSPAEG